MLAMSYQTTNPPGAKQLLAEDPEYVYVDVRTVEEFEQGHVPGAYNVPILFRTNAGMQPNPEFLAVVTRHFGKDRKIVFG
jgi:rhodanese-related sulfurtransferase